MSSTSSLRTLNVSTSSIRIRTLPMTNRPIAKAPMANAPNATAPMASAPMVPAWAPNFLGFEIPISTLSSFRAMRSATKLIARRGAMGFDHEVTERISLIADYNGEVE